MSGPAVSLAASAGNMTPAQRAQVIYTEARAQMSDRLWKAALGGGDDNGNQGKVDPLGKPRGLDGLLSLLQGDDSAGLTAGSTNGPANPVLRMLGLSASLPLAGTEHPTCAADNVPQALPQGSAPQDWTDGNGHAEDRSAREGDGELELHGGPNARYAPMLREAATRTGLPAAALATIVHAEAARSSDGRWLAYSRNSRSSAAGLGQFLNATWIGEAERAGTWLNSEARTRGWLDSRGRVERSDRGELLALRYDPRASIEATADFAKANLDAFDRAGITTGNSVEDVARTAYIGHHLGRGDAIRFLTGQLDPERARTLLDAQIGHVAAARKVASAGNAVAAHRAWLLAYVDRTIKPSRFEA